MSQIELIIDEQHFQRVVRDGMFKANVSLDIATADFKAMLIPMGSGKAQSIVKHFKRLGSVGKPHFVATRRYR